MSEREWREASDMRPSPLGLLLVLSVAAVLRLWHLDHGVPYSVGEDEPQIMARVVHMMRTGDFNPHFFDYPTLYLYIQLVVASVRFVAGATSGAWQHLTQVTAIDFYTWGRFVTAAFGVATVFLVYQIGSRWGARHALLGAGLLAAMPSHVRESHFVLTDVPMTFFTTLAFLLALRAYEKGTIGSFAWAGVATGLAAGTKYYGGLIVIAPLLAAWLPPFGSKRRLLCMLTTIGAAAGAFLIVAPYTALDLPGFLNGIASLGAAVGDRRAGAEAGWLLYLKHLRVALWWPGLAILLSGLGLAIVRAFTGPGRARFVMLVTFPLLYFWLVSTRNLVFARYLMPILPFAGLLMAIVIVSGVSLLRRFDVPRAPRTALIAALTVVAVLPPLYASIQFVRQIGRPSTYAAAYEWVLANVPAGSRVVLETGAMSLPERRFKVEHVPALGMRDYRALVAAGVDYVVASGRAYGPVFQNPERQPHRYQKYREIFDQSLLLKEIKPAGNETGPDLRIYKLTAGGQD